jgi:hypothetical protein
LKFSQITYVEGRREEREEKGVRARARRRIEGKEGGGERREERGERTGRKEEGGGRRNGGG